MAGEQRGGVNHTQDPKNEARGEQPAESIVLRDFEGVNLQSPREDIADNEFAWLEELIPIAPGNLAPVLGPGSALAFVGTETGPPTLVIPFVGASVGHIPTLQNTDNVLAVWANSGNAWIISLGLPTQIATGLFTSGQTAAVAWSNTGVLIVDATAGYYDFGVTTAGTLTKLSGALYNLVFTSTNPPYNTGGVVPLLRVSDPAGTGATIGASASTLASTVSINAAGTGYTPGDVLTAVGGTLTTSSAAPPGTQNQPLVITVLTVSSGAVATYAITNPGYYQIAPTSPISFTGGTGTGFKLNAGSFINSPYIITPGSGYTAPVVQAFISGSWVNYPATIQTSGAVIGTAIASYAGRAWIANGRTVQFTDAASYNSFANSASAFTITDSYLHKSITALYAANNYLYIFGDDSVDILSNVIVVNGVVQFSRINASSSVGTTQPQSIFAYLRSLVFANNSGFYAISGATPEKISDRLDNLIAATNFAQSIYGCQVMVDRVLCMAFLISFSDSFVRSPTQTRSIIALQFRGKWWLTSQLPSNGVNLSSIISYPVGGLSTMFGWAGNAYYPLLSTTNINSWLLKTKLWDLGAPMLDKQAILAGIGLVFGGAPTSGLSVTVDTENTSTAVALGSFPLVQWVNNAATRVQWVNNANAVVSWTQAVSGYDLVVAPANTGGGKYLGLTATGNTNTIQIRLLAIEAEKRRRW